MASLHSVSDSDLLSRMPGLVLAERAAIAEVIEHLIEIDRRELYLDQACSSLYRYCMDRLGYSEDEARRRVRVARLARKLPRVLEELRSGAMNLTGLFLLSGHLTEHNAEALLAEARGQSRREIEKLLARWFPQPDTGTRIQPILALSMPRPDSNPRAPRLTTSSSAIGSSHSATGSVTGWNSSATCPATGRSPVDTRPEQCNSLGTMQSSPVDCSAQDNSLGARQTAPVDTCPELPEQRNSVEARQTRPVDTRPEQGNSVGSRQTRSRIVPLSTLSYRVEFTASAELFAKLERATELVSHAVPRGELPKVIERALDALIEREMRRRVGTGKPRKQRPLKPGSRHVPREVARLVWERDGGQCTFVDAKGRRCSERRYLTLEHRHPFALGGPPTADNVCLLCGRHNAQSARQVFGREHLEKKRSERRTSAQSLPARTVSPEPTSTSN